MEDKKDLDETNLTGGEETEGQKESGDKGSRKSMMSTKNGLYLRTVIGGLILYYAYTIVAEIGSTSADSRAMLYVFVAVFGIAGIWIIMDSLKRIIKKEYED